jgi:hypothetical protein
MLTCTEHRISETHNVEHHTGQAQNFKDKNSKLITEL